MSRVLGWTLVVTLSAALVVSIPRVAQAICPAPVDDLAYEEMIAQRTTGVDGFPIMILGVVVTTKDLGGRPGGSTIAKLAVAEHPVGFAPLVSRVRSGASPVAVIPLTSSSSAAAATSSSRGAGPTGRSGSMVHADRPVS